MLKILVVDDEKPARDKIGYMIEWEETKFEIVDFAKNGKEALSKYGECNPDLIITDISMPIMDGLQLIKKIKEINNKQRFIILSCHENFNYAKEAMRLGVEDYLIKDLATSEELCAILEKVRLELEREAGNLAEPLVNETNSLPINDFDLQYKAIALKSILFNNLSKEQYIEISRQFHLRFCEEKFSLMLVRLDDYQSMKSCYTPKDLSNSINQILITIEKNVNEQYSGECFYDEKGQIIILLSLPSFKSSFKYVSETYDLASAIKYNIQQMGYGAVTSAVYHELCDLKDIYEVYCKLLEVIQYSFFVGKGNVLFSNMSIPKVKPNAPKLLEENIKLVCDYLEKQDKNKIIDTLKIIYKEDLIGFMQFNYIHYVNTKLINIILDEMKVRKISYETLFGCDHIPFDTISGFNEVGEAAKWFCDLFARLIDENSKEAKVYYSKKISKAIEYIDKNYLEDISLTTIAEHIGVHKVYLSRTFKEETGENVTEYIILFRIKKAIQMMKDTDLKLYEIAEKAGFKDARQFSIYFKKIIGITPIEYRNKMI